jgi:homoserine dehydrogenase
MKQIGVGILGFGTVGAGVADGILKHREIISKRAGVDIVLKRIADLDISTPRGVEIPADILTTDAAQVFQGDDIDIVVETIGGTTIAKKFVLEALNNKKSVVTANKKLLAEYGDEIFDAAMKNGVDIYFGAAVGGGIPIIRVVREALVSNEIVSIHGILNGTCNYILTRMENEGLPFETVLKDAQRLGYAEVDPSLDIDGFDTAHKACILASLAYGFSPRLADVNVEGIRNLSGMDVKYASELGYRIKLLASVAKKGGEVELAVHPTLISKSHMLSSVNDAFNAVMVNGDMSDCTMYYGRGAGRQPTASTVVGDIVDVARNIATSSPRYHRAAPNYASSVIKLKAPGEISSKFYIRFMVADKPGAFGTIATILGNNGVSISAASQQPGNGNFLPVVALTHEAKLSNLEKALEEIANSGVVDNEIIKLRVL